MPEFSTMLDLQAQMMLLLAIGVFLAKKKLITDQGRACLTDLLLFIILPANIIQSFRIEFNVEIFRSTRDILILSILLQMLYGVVCAVCYNCYPFARKAVQCTSSCNMTMSMFLIGSRDLHPLLDKDAILYCIIRLFLMLLVVLVGCRAAHVGQLATGVAVVLAGMPMGGTTTILAEKYGADSTFASKCTAISTVLSLITTPLWCLAV